MAEVMSYEAWIINEGYHKSWLAPKHAEIAKAYAAYRVQAVAGPLVTSLEHYICDEPSCALCPNAHAAIAAAKAACPELEGE